MKLNQIILLICILILLIPNVYSASSSKVKIIDDWVHYQHSFTKNGNNYSITPLNTFTGNDSDGLLRFKRNNESFLVKYGECETHYFYTFCFNDTTIDNELADIDDKGAVQPSIYIKIYEYDPAKALKVTKKLSKTKVHLQEQINVELFLENIGDIDLTNMTIYEYIPDGYELNKKGSMWIKQENNNLEIKTMLLKRSNKTYTYTISPIEYVDAKINTSIEYTSEDIHYSEFPLVKKKISIIDPYKMTSKISEDKIGINEVAYYTLTIENKESENLILNRIYFEISPSLAVVSRKNLKKDKSYTYFAENIILEPGEEETFNLKLKGPYTGNYKLHQRIDMETKGTTFTRVFNDLFNVTTDGLDCRIVPDKEIINPGESVWYSLVLLNTGDDEYNHINVSFLDQNLTEQNYTLSKLPLGNNHTLDKKIVTAPLNPSEHIVLNINGTYETRTRQILRCYSQSTIAINSTSIVVEEDELEDESEDSSSSSSSSTSNTNENQDQEDDDEDDETKEDVKNMNFFQKLMYLIKIIF